MSAHSSSSKGRIAAACALVSAMLAPVQASAATDGTLGATSQGNISINASVPARARITGLADVSFLNQDPTISASDAQDVCVWTNTASGTYQITATGSGTGGAFTIQETGGDTVAYTVAWNSTAGQTSGTSLAAGTASSSLTSVATHQSCTTGPANSASLIVGIANTELSTMLASTTYSGTLTLLVTPQ
ncbi:MAG: hypothetical protein H6918_05195 [Sphingomonadaceae bacterium]|nr:hypothetical protein [Sphingomonadaceae bacterium]